MKHIIDLNWKQNMAFETDMTGHKVIIYATSPISKIVGEFTFNEILYEDIEELWRRTKEQAGISKKFFNEYFKEYEKGFAIKIDSYVKYNEYISLDEAYGKAAPQSFIYIDQINNEKFEAKY